MASRKDGAANAARVPRARPKIAHSGTGKVPAGAKKTRPRAKPAVAAPRREDRQYLREVDQRSPFARDRDRILYTTSFRRLAGVTQVVAAGEPYVFHNRLTHTLEVAQIARRIAERLLDDEPEQAEALGGIHPEVAEGAALAHDLGHPPFGHIAEELLDDLMSDKKTRNVRDGFEGNAQSFRIVTKLAVRNEQRGLDLTRATLNAILKYPVFQNKVGPRRPKWGAYESERDSFEFARALSADARPSVKAEIMDLADDIGYGVHDVEDFYRNGLIPLDRLTKNKGDNAEVEAFFAGCRDRWARIEHRPKYADADLFAAFKRVMGAERHITEPFQANHRQRARVRTMTAAMIGGYVRAVTLKPDRDADGQCVLVGSERRMEITMLKELTWGYVIDDNSLATQQEGQRQVIRELFDIFSNAAITQEWRIFPLSTRETLAEASTDHDKLRVACDFIAGLTEQQAVDLFRRLRGIEFGSVLDRLR